jgi:hypothetical protein
VHDVGLKPEGNQAKLRRADKNNLPTKAPRIVTMLSNSVPALKVLMEPRFEKFVGVAFPVCLLTHHQPSDQHQYLTD